jgi:hypothetical protein
MIDRHVRAMPFLFLSWRSHDRTVSAGNLEVRPALRFGLWNV